MIPTGPFLTKVVFRRRSSLAVIRSGHLHGFDSANDKGAVAIGVDDDPESADNLAFGLLAVDEQIARFRVESSDSRPTSQRREPFGRPAGLRLEFEGDFRQSVCYTWGMDGRLSGMILSNAQDRFSTKYYDAETDLYYYGYRYYSPSLGRWISRDPIKE